MRTEQGGWSLLSPCRAPVVTPAVAPCVTPRPQVEFVLTESDYTLKMWPHKFKAVRGGSCLRL